MQLESYDFTCYEHDGYILGLALAGVSEGRCRMAYYLAGPDGTRIFTGKDFSPAPSMACDGPEAAASLLSFLTIQPGDTDDEYFADYTPEQLAWCQSADAEELGSWGMQVEEEGQDWPSLLD